MAISKSYTCLKQSKKLAKILPIESADMSYSIINNIGQGPYHCNIPTFTHATHEDIPCWSLAALLDVLPRIDVEKEVFFKKNTYEYRVKAYIGDGYIGEWHDNLIDACYEMIIRLHEQKLL